jgi:hypothetical protein
VALLNVPEVAVQLYESGCGPLSGSSAEIEIAMTFPVGGLALTESIDGQTLSVPFTTTLPVLDGVWQSIVTDTEVVAPATTAKGAEAPAQLVCPSTEVPVRVSEYPEPAATPPITVLTVDELTTLIVPDRVLGPVIE